jgi:hypothetical protein
LEQKIARNLADRIGDEKDTCARAERCVGQADIGAHLQLRESDIDPIKERDNVENQQERD